MPPENSPPFISMVASTLGRDTELSLLLESLAAQGDDHFELIIVDQNADDRLLPVIAPFKDKFPITRIQTDLKGLDRGRNLGAAHARGDWLLFPDDDSWYPADFLKKLRYLIVSEPADIYSGRSLNADGKEIMVRFLQEDAEISRQNIWQVLIEWVIVLRADVFRAAGGFDENLGVGAGTMWSSGEGQDLVLRCLSRGARGLFRRQLHGYHPEHLESQTTPASIQKMYAYSVGYGFVMRRHGFTWVDMAPAILRPTAGMLIYSLTGRSGMAKRSRRILQGRLDGWRSWEGQPVSATNLKGARTHEC
ncbi:glycosyltransferase family 2 protein [Rhizobium sp. L1K21]|uniref:glycosyltransferase family 2 protein n=1 Tax=Rhizobium sp. L1K21 TaxID=2954933 RepID=UPI002091E5F0|nr:glycosyltransferase family A protein [Rhizobium sp. L1K21]MCO6185302.1 glycosyltransferase family 2 protein [Rhizobium sp. L1K21]